MNAELYPANYIQPVRNNVNIETVDKSKATGVDVTLFNQIKLSSRVRNLCFQGYWGHEGRSGKSKPNKMHKIAPFSLKSVPQWVPYKWIQQEGVGRAFDFVSFIIEGPFAFESATIYWFSNGCWVCRTSMRHSKRSQRQLRKLKIFPPDSHLRMKGRTMAEIRQWNSYGHTKHEIFVLFWDMWNKITLRLYFFAFHWS